jgi:GNAT superfamily N-acetyltransferase
MSAGYRICAATKQDAEAIAALSSELGYASDPKTMQSRLTSILSSTQDLLLMAVDHTDKPIAWMQAHASHVVESGYRVEILGLVVAASARRRGIGRALVTEAEKWAKDKSASSIVVRSNTKRHESHAFYPALGYTNSKTQQVYRKSID